MFIFKRTETLMRWPYVLFGLALLFAAVCDSPAWYALPGRDSGVYLYIGQHLLRGAIPYRDIWDHKPPGVYYLDAFGLWLGQGSLWGVWLLEVLTLAAAAALSFRLIGRHFGVLAATFATTLWLVTAPLLLGGGNTPEEFALPLQFLALQAMDSAVSLAGAAAQGMLYRRGLLIGGLALAAFMLKPTLIGIWIAFGIVWGVHCFRDRRPLNFATLAAGIVTSVIIGSVAIALYLASQGALGSAIEAVFLYNVDYAAVSTGERLQTLLFGFQVIALSGLAVLALLGWGLSLLRASRRQESSTAAFIWIALIAFPIEGWLASLSGRSYAHYFLPWLPVSAILVASVVRRYSNRAARRAIATGQVGRQGERFIAFLLLLLCVTPLAVAAYQARQIEQRPTVRPFIDTVADMTPPDKTMLVWGAEASINLVTRRDAPTRFVYQLPLYTASAQSQAMRAAFLHDLGATPPATIVDASANNVDDSVPPLAPALRAAWLTRHPALADDATLAALFDFIDRDYRVTGPVDASFPIYVRSTSGERGMP